MKAYLNLRYTVAERRKIFTQGLERLGYTVVDGLTMTPGDRDILVTWNRIGQAHQAAKHFQTVLVTENATWGNDFCGEHWYTMARDYHNTAGCFPVLGHERWDQLGVELQPWRTSGETVILPQRGIGPPGVAMPRDWPRRQPGRLRPHPGKNPRKPLHEDLANAGKVVTWGSGAAVKALMWGIPVESHMPNWIARQDNTDAGRLAMLRRLASAQWRLEEIRCGDALSNLINES